MALRLYERTLASVKPDLWSLMSQMPSMDIVSTRSISLILWAGFALPCWKQRMKTKSFGEVFSDGGRAGGGSLVGLLQARHARSPNALQCSLWYTICVP